MRLIIAAVYKELIYKKRYLANTIISMVMFCAIFIALITGYSAISGQGSLFNYGESTGALIVSYYAWTMMLSVFTSTGYIVTVNKQSGILENIMCNTPHFVVLLICESLVSSFVYFIFSWLIIGVLTWICNVTIHILILDVFIVLMIGLLSVLGFSLLVAGSALVLRKTEGIMSILQFVLLGALFLPDSYLTRLFSPFFTANQMLTEIFINGTRISSFQLMDYLMLFGNSAVYIVIGVFVFSLCMRKAKQKGNLSFY